MPYLFSYGTLQEVLVQKAVFGRELNGCVDVLPGFELSKIKAYGSYPVVMRTDDLSQKISGMIFELKDAEMKMADKYEGKEYTRISVDLKSGKKAWLYVGT